MSRADRAFRTADRLAATLALETGISASRPRHPEVPRSTLALETGISASRPRHPGVPRSTACRLVLVAAVLLAAAAVVRADIDVYLYTGSSQDSATVTPGATLNLYTYLSTDGEGVGGMYYSIECPDTSWSLSARDYASYGWYHDDGLFDNSTPVPADATFPVAIAGDLFIGTDPTVADFSLNTSRNPAGSTITSGTIETFALIVPTTPGVYGLDFGILDALDGAGGGLIGDIGHSFTVTVAAVPEPSGLLLLGLAVAGAVGLRRCRR